MYSSMSKRPKITQRLSLLLLLVLAGSFVSLLFEMVPAETDNIPLPSPDLEGHLPLSSAILRTKPADDLRPYQIEISEVSQLLWALQGITHGPGFRTVPSAGGTYPLEIFVVHEETPTLSEGCYHYIPQGHQLEFTSPTCNLTDLLSTFEDEDKEALTNASTAFLILVDYARTTMRYGDRGVQYVHLEVGHAIQNFLLQATSLDLCTRVITNFTPDGVQSFLDTDLDPLAILPLGLGVQFPVSTRSGQFALADADEITVEQAIAKRKSIRDYQSGSIPLSILSDVLDDSTAITHLVGNESQLDIRLVAGEVEGLATGSYLYAQENGSLEQISLGDLRPSLRIAGLDQHWIENAQLDVVMSVNITWVDQQPNPSFHHRVMMFNVGMIAQNVYLKCAAQGLGTVVIGAFYEDAVSQVVEIPGTLKPVYIMPIGLPSGLLDETDAYQLQMTDIARASGVLALVAFYCSLYLSVPTIRQRIQKRARWVHCFLGVIPLVGLVIHSMIIHGHVRDLWGFFNISSYGSALSHFISGVLSAPMISYDIGKFVAYLSIPLVFITSLSGFGLASKRVKRKKILRKIHKHVVFLTLILLVLHALMNGVQFVRDPVAFILVNVLAAGLYCILYFYPSSQLGQSQT